jgi:hypothetical protein
MLTGKSNHPRREIKVAKSVWIKIEQARHYIDKRIARDQPAPEVK